VGGVAELGRGCIRARRVRAEFGGVVGGGRDWVVEKNLEATRKRWHKLRFAKLAPVGEAVTNCQEKVAPVTLR